MKRKVYLSKKGNKFIFEGKRDGKTIYIYTIPNDYESYLNDMIKSSFFTQEKSTKIATILLSLDLVETKYKKTPPKVRPINIIRSQEKDDKEEETDEGYDQDYDLDNQLKEVSDRVKVEDE